VSIRFDITDLEQRAEGLAKAKRALGRKQVVVIPTDTGYALAANAFSPAGVATLGEIKGWTTRIPPQVLIPGMPTLDALVAEVAEPVRKMAEKFWPGPLTIIAPAGDSLLWDLGDDSGTVALRLSGHEFCQELVSAVGPLAVSFAVKAGNGPGNIDDIVQAFEEDVDYFLVDPGMKKTAPSTIVDATAIGLPEGKIRVLREGKVTRAQLKKVVGADLLAPAE